MNRTVHDAAREWLAADRPAVVVEVVDFKGSVPRETGTRMLVAADAVVGTIGGGHLELEAIAHARTLLPMGNEHHPHERDIALGPTLGQCCGGVLRLRWQALTSAVLSAWPTPSPRFHLQLYGAGHVGRAHRTPAGRHRLPGAVDRRARQRVSGRSVAAAHRTPVCRARRGRGGAGPAGACYLVLTHSHDLDLRITEAILRRGDFGYLGLIGSATKRARFVHRFEQRGIAADTLARLTCPIGVPGINGKEPEVIALAVVAQLLQRSPA